MTYATLMVHLEPGRSNAGLLHVASGLAERLGAGVIGIAACQPLQLIYNDGCYVPNDLIQEDRDTCATQIREAETEFRRAMEGHVQTLGWRSAVTAEPLEQFLAREARGADLVITATSAGAGHDATRRVNAGDLVMQLGRPVLAVPQSVGTLGLHRVVVAWKDTPEPRRAAMDALPLLKLAAHVAVVEVAPEEDLPATRTHLQDVVGWLGHHGVRADALAVASDGGDAAQLASIVDAQDADLVVAGAYGHSRVREWAFGGVTRGLLANTRRCALVSH